MSHARTRRSPMRSWDKLRRREPKPPLRFDAALSPCRAIRPLPLAFDSAWFFLFGLMVLVAVARPVSQPRLTGLTLRLAAVGEILQAVERPDMGCIVVAVGPPDAEFLFVRV